LNGIFLENAKTSSSTWYDNECVEILPGKSHHIYFRGLRVYDLPEGQTTLRTYNVLGPLQLTEDRTVKYMHEVYTAIANQLVLHTDETFIKEILSAPKSSFEAKLDMTWAYKTPSSVFVNTVLTYGAANPRFAKFAPTPTSYGYSNWRRDLIFAIQSDDIVTGWDLIQRHKSEVKHDLENTPIF
jgi:hypothetical protein